LFRGSAKHRSIIILVFQRTERWSGSRRSFHAQTRRASEL
jgi:hypothetical protein